MRFESIHWDELIGICTLHNVPQLPCPACLAGKGHIDLEIHLNEMDRISIDFGDELAMMVPANLAESVTNGKIQVF